MVTMKPSFAPSAGPLVGASFGPSIAPTIASHTMTTQAANLQVVRMFDPTAVNISFAILALSTFSIFAGLFVSRHILASMLTNFVWALRIKTVDEKLRLSGTGTGTGTGNNRRSVRKSMMLPRSVFSWGALETRTEDIYYRRNELGEYIGQLGLGSFGLVLKYRDNRNNFLAVKWFAFESEYQEELSRVQEIFSVCQSEHLMEFKGCAWATRCDAPFEVPRDHRLYGLVPESKAALGSNVVETFSPRNHIKLETTIVHGIVMNCEIGGGLDSFFAGRGYRLTTQQKRCIIDGAVDALLALQKHEFVHGDLKPANFVLRKPVKNDYDMPHVVLIDFGNSRRHTRDSVYTLASFDSENRYVAPERLDHHRALNLNVRPTMQSDVYSLGVLFLDLLLFGDDDYQGSMSDINSKLKYLNRISAEKLDGFPEGFRSVIISCVQERPSERRLVCNFIWLDLGRNSGACLTERTSVLTARSNTANTARTQSNIMTARNYPDSGYRNVVSDNCAITVAHANSTPQVITRTAYKGSNSPTRDTTNAVTPASSFSSDSGENPLTARKNSNAPKREYSYNSPSYDNDGSFTNRANNVIAMARKYGSPTRETSTGNVNNNMHENQSGDAGHGEGHGSPSRSPPNSTTASTVLNAYSPAAVRMRTLSGGVPRLSLRISPPSLPPKPKQKPSHA